MSSNRWPAHILVRVSLFVLLALLIGACTPPEGPGKPAGIPKVALTRGAAAPDRSGDWH